MIGDHEFDRFLNASIKAISRYAEEEYQRLARRVEYRLRRMPVREYRNFWHAYCEETQRGPSPLRAAFECDNEKIVEFVVSEIPHQQAVLLTMVAMWHADDFEAQDGDLASTEMMKERVSSALQQLALDDETVLMTRS